MTPLLYVAGPYRAATRAAIAANIERARQVGILAARLGWYPVIPHCNTAHMELDADNGDDFWLAGTLEMMTRCDAVVLVPGWETSAGTAGEIAKADQIGLTVFRDPSHLPSAQTFIEWMFARVARRA